MPENDPEKDVWSKKPKPEGPPDLDEIVNKLQKKLNSLFTKKKQAATGAKPDDKAPQGKVGWLWFIVFAVVLVWFLAGIFIVSPAERAAVLRFGKYVATVGPGPHWIPRFIKSKRTVNVQNISTFPYHAEMLTKDENIVSVAIAVQYRVENIQNYLFNVVDSNGSLQQATASALRQVVGHTTLDEILTTGREEVREQLTKQLNDILGRYNTGLVITDVTLQPTKPPEAVTEAFDDVNKAREDEQRYINAAKAYQQKVVPIAEGGAKRILREAEAYEQRVTLDAKANIARFLAILPQYVRAPVVTRERLYLNAITAVLTKSTTMLIDTKGGNVLYLPLNKLLGQQHLRPIRMPAANMADGADKTETEGPTVNHERPSYGSAGGNND